MFEHEFVAITSISVVKFVHSDSVMDFDCGSGGGSIGSGVGYGGGSPGIGSGTGYGNQGGGGGQIGNGAGYGGQPGGIGSGTGFAASGGGIGSGGGYGGGGGGYGGGQRDPHIGSGAGYPPQRGRCLRLGFCAWWGIEPKSRRSAHGKIIWRWVPLFY